jgi:metallo-beta-lactamase family protein
MTRPAAPARSPVEPRPDVPVLTFLGATGTVTGSRYLVDTPTARVLIDCGLYQGIKELRQRNWAPFPVDPGTIDAVVLSHAHIDHTGYVPVLTSHGYTGPIFASEKTVVLAGIVLPDSGHLQEEEARYANRRGFSKHKPALPLYTEQDARTSLEQFRSLPFGETHTVAEGVRVTLQPAGHILGSSTITLELDGSRNRDGSSRPRRVVFSGDLGRPGHPILAAPHPLGDADVVLVESTYGNRVHDDRGALEEFGAAITRTAARGGVVLIPAFAVDRTEVLLVHLKTLLERGAIPNLPIYVDSPMALAALSVYRTALGEHGVEIRDDVRAADDPFGHTTVHEVREVAGSMELDRLTAPAIIVSASGMATGGRVLHHLARYLPDHRASIILVGFQAEQTRGRQLADGARQVKLLGKYTRVAADVVDLPSFSVHADREGLLDWLGTAEREPEIVYVVHGEPSSSDHLRDAIEARLGWTAVVPTYGERVRLD